MGVLPEVHIAYVPSREESLDSVGCPSGRCHSAFERTGTLLPMPFVFLVSREPKMRSNVTEYLRERGYDTATAPNYDLAMESLDAHQPDAVVVDVQGLPRGEQGATFSTFNQWLSVQAKECSQAVIYLLRKGARRPNFKVGAIGFTV